MKSKRDLENFLVESHDIAGWPSPTETSACKISMGTTNQPATQKFQCWGHPLEWICPYHSQDKSPPLNFWGQFGTTVLTAIFWTNQRAAFKLLTNQRWRWVHVDLNCTRNWGVSLSRLNAHVMPSLVFLHAWCDWNRRMMMMKGSGRTIKTKFLADLLISIH